MLAFKEGCLAALAHQVRNAEAPSSTILREVVSATCRRGRATRRGTQLARLEQFIDDGASTDAALTMIELELPSCKLSRLIYDDGKWHCALSRQRELPDWLDDAVETRHASLPLALLGAYLEALLQSDSVKAALPSVPSRQPHSCERLCCENFS